MIICTNQTNKIILHYFISVCKFYSYHIYILFIELLFQ